MDPQPHDERRDNPSQHPVSRAVDGAVLGRTPQTARFRMTVFIILFIAAFGTLFYLLNS